MEDLKIKNGGKISIQSQFGRRYIKQKANNKLNCQGCHPFLHRQDEDKFRTTFVIINPDSGEGDTLKFCSLVYLMSLDGLYLISNPNGDVLMERVDKKELSAKDPERNLMKFRKWSILNYTNLITKKEIIITDDLIFKSSFGNYLKNDKGGIVANSSLITDDIVFNIKNAEELALPKWSILRPYQSNLFFNAESLRLFNNSATFFSQLNYDGNKSKTKFNFKNNYEYEQYVIGELIYSLTSNSGHFIQRFYDDVTGFTFYEFNQHEHFDINFVQMINRILPLSSIHDYIKLFEELFGAVNKSLNMQGFCEGLYKIRKEYYTVIYKIEEEYNKGELDIQKLWLYLQQPMKNFEQIKMVLEKIYQGKEHELTVLYDFIRTAVDR